MSTLSDLRSRVRSRLDDARRTRAEDAAEVTLARADERRGEVRAGSSNFAPAHVPWAVDLAAAWSWRMIVIAVVVYGLFQSLVFLGVIVLPLLIALLLAALLSPVVALFSRFLPRGIASLLVVLLGIAAVVLLLTFVGQQIAGGFNDLSKQVVVGVGQVRDWLRTGPLHVSDSQISHALTSLQELISGKNGHILSTVGEVGTTLGHVVAGLFIVLFSTYFFLADGAGIWAWLVRLFPRAARLRADSSGRVAWRSLTQFVRATVLVAATDAAGVMIGAAILGVPFVSAIGVLVFLGAFIPLIGAFVSGTVAVLVALVANGPVNALIMLGVIVLVQQIESHGLQPFLMGRFVSVHPLGVIVAIAAGVLIAGIPGALIAVPFSAALNAVVQHLAAYTNVGETATTSLRRDDGPPPQPPPVGQQQGDPESLLPEAGV